MPTLADAFRVVRREMRVTSGGLRSFHGGAQTSTARAFGLAIARRYAGQDTLGPIAQMTVRRLRTEIHLHTASYHTQVHVAPRPELNLRAWLHSVVPAGATGTSGLAPGIGRQIEAQVVQRQLTRQVEHVQINQLVRRLATRGERVEPGAQSGTAQGDQVGATQAAPAERRALATYIVAERPATMIVRRAPRPDGADHASHAQGAQLNQPIVTNSGQPGAQRPPQPNQPIATNSGQPATNAGVIDLNRVADQVIQVIDRRIIAQRERLGRL